MNDYYKLYAPHVREIKQIKPNQFQGRCPFHHPDIHPSFFFEDIDGLSHCKAGCGGWNPYTFSKAIGFDPKPYSNGTPTKSNITPNLIPKKERNGDVGENRGSFLGRDDKRRSFTYHKYLMENFDKLTKGLPWTLEAVEKTFTGCDTKTERFTFLHTDTNGKAVNIKYHKSNTGEKPFSIQGHGQCRLFPLNLIKDYEDGSILIIAEGEKDVITLLSMGFNAVTSTTGADSFPDLTPLKRFKTVYILYDNDEAGRAGSVKLAKALKHQLPESKITISDWGNDRPCKFDVSDFFSQDWDRFDLLEAFDKILNSGKEYELDDNPTPQRKNKLQIPSFDPSIEAEIFKKDRDIIFHNDTLKQYDGGFYKSFSDRYFLHLLTGELKIYNSRQAKAKETLEVIKNSLSDPKLLDEINPDPYIINCKNGLFDIRDMELKPHTPDFISTFQINAEYDSESDIPLFDKFLSEILIKDDGNPDSDLICIIQEFMGYCLFTSIPFHKALIFYGEGSNGKSVLVEVMEFLFTGHTSSVHFEIIGIDSFATADLTNSLLNISAEIGSKAHFKDNIIKQLISGDSIRAQHKNQDAFDLKPIAKHILTANNFPYSADKSFAFFRRFLIIPFNQRFLSEKEIEQQPDEIKESLKVEDPYLIDKLKDEADGIFYWALDGLNRLMINKGFTESEQVREFGEIFKIRSSSVETFITEMTGFSSDGQILFADGFKQYIEFCKKYKIPALTNRKFSNELKNQGFLVEKGTENKTFIKGISWKNDSYLSY